LVLFVVAAALTGQGCGGGGDTSDQEAITAVVNELFAAQDSGDAAKACDDIYVIQEPGKPASESEADGEAEADGDSPDACESAFESANERRQAEVKNLTNDISSVEVDGDTATATVHTELERQDGSHLSQDVPYDLVRTSDGWRIRISEEG
jgi:ketosteroid isomerase-like protein